MREQILEHISDAELMQQLSATEAANNAIHYLYRSYYGLLAQFVVSNNGSDADAQDIFQEVVVAFIQLVKTGKFRGESSIKTFLYALNRNIWFNELKKRTRTVNREKRYELVNEKKEPLISEVIEGREASKLMSSVMSELGESCRQILLLYYYQEKSMKEIVENTEYENEQVVRNKKYKCLKKLEEKMNADPILFKKLKHLLHV